MMQESNITAMKLYCILLISMVKIDVRSCSTTKWNSGQWFFQQLIDDENAYRHVNETTMCALMHFFFDQAAHNGRSVEFSSGSMIQRNELIFDDFSFRYVRSL